MSCHTKDTAICGPRASQTARRHRLYHAIYYNRKLIFLDQPDGFYAELPLTFQSIFVSPLSMPGPLRAVYHPPTGIIYGVIGHGTIVDRGFHPPYYHQAQKL